MLRKELSMRDGEEAALNRPARAVGWALRVLQGALIGLGAVLPGISGGVLCVVFGIYKPVMELLSNPLRNWRTHLPRLLPVILGAAIGFLGVANLLAFFLEAYPDQSVCLFVGLCLIVCNCFRQLFILCQ